MRCDGPESSLATQHHKTSDIAPVREKLSSRGQSKTESQRLARNLEDLRNSLAHAQDIVTHDWVQTGSRWPGLPSDWPLLATSAFGMNDGPSSILIGLS